MRDQGRHLYVMQMAMTGAIKIGRSSNVKRRLSEIQTGCPYKVRVILTLENQGHREREMHQRLASFRTRRYSGEWFEEDGLPSLPDSMYERLDLDQIDWWREAS